MNRAAKWAFAALLLVLFSVPRAHAQVINATDCSSGAVQAALNSVTADGTTIVVPAGTCTWTTAVTYSQKYSTVLQGQTTVAGTCAPGGSCTPSDATTITIAVGGTAFSIGTAIGKSLRITGFTFISTSGTPGYGKITVYGGSTAFRWDHSHFDDQTSGDHLFNVDAVNGVFDHNYFDSSTSVDTFFFQPTVNGPDGNSNQVWTQPESFGTGNFVFIENNFFQRGWFAYDCDFGGRMVFRFNIVGTGTRIQTHGVGSGAERRGCRAIESYQNTFQFSTNPTGNCSWPTVTGSCNSSNFYFPFLVDYESGTGMWWGNNVSGFQTYLRQQEVRRNNATYTQTATPAGWGYCGTSFSGTGSGWDQNSNASSGYMCLDQIGAGAGDLLTGSFPNKINQRTGTIAWPNQAHVPSYVWNSTLNSFPNISLMFWANLGGGVTENQDYYLQLPNNNEPQTFNGTAGIGQGTLASIPATCTPFVGYWATDQGNWNQSGSGGQGIFYQCTATNTWTVYYTPYTYPHPLTSGATPPNPPTNVSVVVQ